MMRSSSRTQSSSRSRQRRCRRRSGRSSSRQVLSRVRAGVLLARVQHHRYMPRMLLVSIQCLCACMLLTSPHEDHAAQLSPGCWGTCTDMQRTRHAVWCAVSVLWGVWTPTCMKGCSGLPAHAVWLLAHYLLPTAHHIMRAGCQNAGPCIRCHRMPLCCKQQPRPKTTATHAWAVTLSTGL